MKLAFLYEKVAESMWLAMRWACNDKESVVIDALKKVYRWRSTRWWYALHTTMMIEDPENRTRWKLKWGCHNRVNVWDMMATPWAGERDWMMKRKEYTVYRLSRTLSGLGGPKNFIY